MPSPPFEQVALASRGILLRLLGRELSVNACRELKNALATAKYFSEIDASVFERLRRKYGFDVRKQYPNLLLLLYEEAARYYLSRAQVSEADADSLLTLEQALGIAPDKTKEVRIGLSERAFFPLVLNTAVSGRDTPSFELSLAKLASVFALTHLEALKVYESVARNMLGADERALGDQPTISPDKEAALLKKAHDLGIEWKADSSSETGFVRGRRNWDLLNAELVPVAVSIALTKAEQCIWSSSAERYENRKERVMTTYTGVTSRVKVMRGVYFRQGAVKTTPITKDVLREVDRGQFYLTTKRVIFAGKDQTISLKWENILEFYPHVDGVEIRRSSGKNLIFAYSGDHEDCALLMFRMMQANGSSTSSAIFQKKITNKI